MKEASLPGIKDSQLKHEMRTRMRKAEHGLSMALAKRHSKPSIQNLPELVKLDLPNNNKVNALNPKIISTKVIVAGHCRCVGSQNKRPSI